MSIVYDNKQLKANQLVEQKAPDDLRWNNVIRSAAGIYQTESSGYNNTVIVLIKSVLYT